MWLFISTASTVCASMFRPQSLVHTDLLKAFLEQDEAYLANHQDDLQVLLNQLRPDNQGKKDVDVSRKIPFIAQPEIPSSGDLEEILYDLISQYFSVEETHADQ